MTGENAVRLGVDRVAAGDVELPRSARYLFLTNQSARSGDGRWSGEAIRAAGYRLIGLLAPEHGLDVAAAAGAPIAHGEADGLPVYSLYGADLAPVAAAIQGCDAVLVDLPDVGCRYYTYPWTVRELLKLASVAGKPVMVLDRPNPLGGAVEGNLPDPGFDSAVCSSRVPARHGLTLAELARWQRRELGLDLELVPVPAAGWRRDMLWPETGLTWIAPSPNLRSFAAALLYPGTCLVEGTNVSEGRGTVAPFQMLGAPFLDAATLARELGGQDALAAADVVPVSFTPQSGKWQGERCHGVRLRVRDVAALQPVRLGLAILAALREWPEFSFLPRSFDALAGTSSWREALQARTTPEQLAAAWTQGEQAFARERRAVALY